MMYSMANFMLQSNLSQAYRTLKKSQTYLYYVPDDFIKVEDRLKLDSLINDALELINHYQRKAGYTGKAVRLDPWHDKIKTTPEGNLVGGY